MSCGTPAVLIWHLSKQHCCYSVGILYSTRTYRLAEPKCYRRVLNRVQSVGACGLIYFWKTVLMYLLPRIQMEIWEKIPWKTSQRMRETLFTPYINISTLPQVLSTKFENKGNGVLRLQGTTSPLFRLRPSWLYRLLCFSTKGSLMS